MEQNEETAPGIQGDPTVINMQAIPVQEKVQEKLFEALIIVPGGNGTEVKRKVVCKDFKITESGGCITLIKPDGKRVCVAGNSSTVIIDEN